MTLFGDIERVPVVGAKRHERRGVLVEHFGERMQILRHRSLADQDGHALRELLTRLARRGRLVVGTDARGKVGVELAAGEERRVAVDMAVPEGDELVERRRVAGEHAGKIHELSKPDHFWMVGERHEVGGGKRGAGRLERRRRYAGRKLHPEVHDRALRRRQEIADAVETEHVGDLVRIADRRRHAVRKDAAVELKRRHQRGFDVKMRVDEAGGAGKAAPVDLARPLVAGMRSDNAVADDSNVGFRHGAGDDVEQLDVAHHEVGGCAARARRDRAGEERPGF